MTLTVERGYKICRECDQVYVSETGHDFKVELVELKTTVLHGLEKNAVFQHVKNKSCAAILNKNSIIYHLDLESNCMAVE